MLHRLLIVPVSSAILLLLGSHDVYASSRDLISSVYNADFVEYKDIEDARFSLDGELGVIVSSGNTNAKSFRAGLKSEYENRHFFNQYLMELLYKETEVEVDDGYEDQISAQRLYTYIQCDYKLAESNRRLFVYGDYENDKFTGYNYQASMALGWSQLSWKDDSSSFRYSIGPGYTLARLDSGERDDDVDGMIVRASAEYRYSWKSGAKLRQFLSTEAGDENTKSRFETSLSANLFDTLAMKLSVILNHNSNATEDASSFNSETSIALVYRFF
jgi:putative salt-induced outer membrane protein YdiY